ncbi:MAG: hypothetical protein KAQ66_00220 [Rhodospirillaceae bacterium]|nr:hypothetical protein [Rhodospirillaceae bacterium]
MSISSNHATLNEEAGTQSGSVEKTQIATEHMLAAIGKVERAIDEKITRDIEAKNNLDNSSAEIATEINAKMSAEIDELKAELARLNSENNELHQAVNNAGNRLDNAIETLSRGLSAP